MVRLLRTNAFRLAAIYFGLFAVSVSALLVFIYFSTADFIEQQTEVTIDAEITGLREQYRERGLAGLVEIIRARVAGQHSDTSLYLITDATLQPLAGNISGWPGAVPARPTRISFPVHSKSPAGDDSDTALAAVFPLPGGYLLLVGRDLHDARVFRSRITETLSWAALLTLALGVVGGLFMTRNMLRRVEAVNRTSTRIIHGDLSQRVPLTGSGDEFDQLAGNLNAMLDQIERLMAGMRQVTDNIAHDLRTPLARLRARLEVTLLERPDATLYAEALRETITEADRLLGTFNALLSIAEAEAGSRRQTMAVVDVAEIARAVAELYEPAAEEKGLRLDIANGGVLPVRGDRHLLSQAIANLLDNALKYTPSGAVSLTTRESAEGARIEVADRGPGVPADRREAVFDRFVRLEGSRSTPGNGLGLSLVRAVATLHGGSAWLEDNNPGVRAVITLPRVEAPALMSTRNAA
ncbi:MAG TPA: HAMP domain-containing sensor histidine kinase [Stellaceae bacterium]|jgi:signal transduction histidine kinase|nr:HAMP domain-containing sensor histidine kinase [Stellaceae bacterium]